MDQRVPGRDLAPESQGYRVPGRVRVWESRVRGRRLVLRPDNRRLGGGGLLFAETTYRCEVNGGKGVACDCIPSLAKLLLPQFAAEQACKMLLRSQQHETMPAQERAVIRQLARP